MGSAPIRTQLYLEPRVQHLMGNTGKKRKTDWLGVSLAPVIFTYSFSKEILEFRLWSMDAHWSHVQPDTPDPHQ